MSVIVEFTVADEGFTLGQVLAHLPDVYIEIERIVPTGSSVIPFLWVQGEYITDGTDKGRRYPRWTDTVGQNQCPLRPLKQVPSESP